MKDRHVKVRLHNLKAVTYTKAYGILHPIRPQILCSSFKGRQYADSPRMISEMLHEQHPEIDVVWALNSSDDPYGLIPAYVKKVRYSSKEYYQALAQSFCFVTNNEIRPDVTKRAGQLFIQTWHGDRGFKKVLYDDLGVSDDKYRSNVVRDDVMTDYCIAASDFGEKVYRTAFRYSGNILKAGMPRNDNLINIPEEEVKKIKSRLHLEDNYKIITYAPTFRDNKIHEACEIVNLEELVIWLNRNTGESWKGLYRAHSLGKGIGSQEHVLDVSDYPDMADLMLITDAMVTDYSSVAGDYMLLDRPMVLALFDLDDYLKNSRKFNVSLDEVGFPIAKNLSELHSLLLDSIQQSRLIGREKAMKYYGVTETGDSTEQIVQLILEHYKKQFKHKL